MSSLIFCFSVFFIGTGIYSLATPKKFAKLLGLSVDGVSGEIEVRAQYGGFFFVAGLLQCMALLELISIQIALIASLMIFAGLALGRFFALIFLNKNEKINSMVYALYWVDSLGCLLSIYGLYQLN